MSENLSSLSSRDGMGFNVFERMSAALDSSPGTAESRERLRHLAEESLFGEAMTLGAASFYDAWNAEIAGKKVRICNGTACMCAGTQELLRKDLLRHFAEDEIGSICCLGRCYEGGSFQYQGRNYSGLSSSSDLDDVLRSNGAAEIDGHYAVISSLQPPQLTAPFPGIDSYYAPLRAMLGESRDWLKGELEDSGLRGRGGAGFPLHLKWQACRMAEGAVKYVVCNADEGDPGSYIDRYLMEERPHSVLLGMLAAGWFAGAENGILYIRAEYPESVRRMGEAIAELHDAGLLGNHILGSDFNFSLRIIKGAGAYICGEETALLASIEGLRPEVRVRPPYPTTHGLFGKPTIINNVETLSNIHSILMLGGKAYGSIGTPECTGPKLLSLDSNFVRPGIYEVAMGSPLKAVIDQAGGFRIPVKALQIGGPLGGIVPMTKIDGLTVDFESFQSAGFLLGHGGVVSIPESLPMIRFIEYLFRFTADESCGKCFPCRLGSLRGWELIAKARANGGFKIDPSLMDDLLEILEQTSLCGLGSGLSLPVRNAFEYFGNELHSYFKS